MEIFSVLLAITFLIVLVGRKQFMKYFAWIERTTGYKPYSTTNKLLMGASLLLPSFHIIAAGKDKPTFLDAVLYLIPVAVLVYRNLTIKTPAQIVLVSLIQTVFAPAFALVAIVIFAFMLFNGHPEVINATKKKQQEFDFRMSQIKESWIGHESDYERANKLGYSTPEDAIKAGYMYDGTYIYL